MIRSSVLILAVSALYGNVARAAAQTPYHVVQTIAVGGEGGWDYVTVDPGPARRPGRSRDSDPITMNLPHLFHLWAAVPFAALAASAEAQTAQLVGEWSATYNTPGGPRSFKILFQVQGDSLSGIVKRSDGEVPLRGTIKGDQVNFSYTIAYNNEALALTIVAKVTGDTMAGTVDFAGMAQEEFSAKRVKAP